MARLSGITVVVTGADRAIGQAIVRRVVAEGAKVIAAVAPDAAAAGGQGAVGPARTVELDVTNRSSWDSLLASVSINEGSLHGLVNAAATIKHGPLQEMTGPDLAQTLSVNLLGPTLGIAAAAPALASAGGGSVVNVATTAGQRGTPNAAALSAASWGLRGLTRSAALEFGIRGIRVNTVGARPELFDEAVGSSGAAVLADSGAERHVTIGDIAAMVVFLLSDDSATCTGGDYVVDGGATA